jgi:hypothetical protein
MAPWKLGTLGIVGLAVWLGVLAPVGLGPAPAVAQGEAARVTLPLESYHELVKAAEAPEKTPPAPALESAVMELEMGADAARLTMTLRAYSAGDGAPAFELPALGALVAVDAPGGRLTSKQGKWWLELEGEGRREVRLEAVLPLEVDDAAGRPERRLHLEAPWAAVVRGTLRGIGDEQVEALGSAVLEDGGVPGARTFVAAPGQKLGFRLLAGAPAVDAGARFRARSRTVLQVERRRLRAAVALEVDVRQGTLEELEVELPEAFDVVQVNGELADWSVEDGVLRLEPPRPVSGEWGVNVSLAAPRGEEDPVTTPRVEVRGAAEHSSLGLVRPDGDGLLELVDLGGARLLTTLEIAEMGTFAALSGPVMRLDPAAAMPRWRVEWARGTEVLTAQVDRLRADVLVGGTEGGDGAVLDLWLSVRSSGAAELVLEMPVDARLLSARRDGRLLALSGQAGRWTLPLALGERTQVFHLTALLALALPEEGVWSLPLPRASAPVAEVEVRALLPAGKSYQLLEPARTARLDAPPGVTTYTTPRLAQQLQSVQSAGPRGDTRSAPAGYRTLEASWSALGKDPGPLRLEVETNSQRKEWF